MMHREMRMVNVGKVSEGLARGERAFRSDQSLIWNKVDELACDLKVVSSTGAMRDVYEAKGGDLDGYLKAFKVVEGTKGVLVFIDGKAAGMDFVSSGKAFEGLFPKLVKSYAMEAMLLAERRKHGRGKGDAGEGAGQAGRGRSPGVPEAGRGVRGEEVRVGRPRLGLPLLRGGHRRIGAGFQRQGRPHGLLRRRNEGRPGGGRPSAGDMAAADAAYCRLANFRGRNTSPPYFCSAAPFS